MMSMNEELQSTNEELTTVNDELKSKVDQISVAHADLTNFFNSTNIAMLVVDDDLRLRSFTPAARDIFALAEESIGRRLPELSSDLATKDIVRMATASVDDGTLGERRFQTPDRRDFIVRTYPYRLRDDEIAGATLVITDVTQTLQLENDLRAERQRLHLALEVAKIGIWEYEPSTGRTTVDATERDLLGLGADDDGARMEPILAKLPAEDRARITLALGRAMDGTQDFDEIFRLPLADGGVRWLHGMGRRILAGKDQKFIGVTFDITPERKVLEERELMIQEMNHRVKNHFAVMAGMISISAREATDVTSFAQDLRRRIEALGRSHALTTDGSRSAGATLKTLIEVVLKPTVSQQTLSLEGVETVVPLSQISALALILHEWATNSTKYGALSVPDGQLNIKWQSDDGTTRLDWKEVGQSSLPLPKSGFGTSLVKAASLQLGGEATGEKTQDGYIRSLRFKTKT